MTPLARRDIPTPLGPLTLVADEESLLGAYFADHRRRPELDAVAAPDSHAVLEKAAAAFEAYFSGEAADVPVDDVAPGTPFQRDVWQSLRAIPAGETRTYAQIAQALGRPSATRAVAGAIGRNPLTIAVPCHRVIGADGSLTGYAGGVDRKRWLLAHERGA
ncbi:methylated-DNA--[protein]-cysteine S-methyltransferase [Demequina mangrovi]|uniref:Methylated-DNA--protein-cysteine methyltransferase n=1 Tax=Demequina mangrovi TaxID=1043493 RepID=A0A1H6XKI8_9MICO|nr:methylated-DNA--[protein]-cysteine S-methyltransferase [Demequina mangrovi]SEJ25075.1 methylated-DNA-[protein]-cysteine S-methyltransferase [Demequina mangrovi]